MMDLPWYRKNEEKKNIHQATHTPMPALVYTCNRVCAPPPMYMAPCACTHVCILTSLVCIIGKSVAPSRPQFCHLYNGDLITELKSLPAWELCNLVPAHSYAHGHTSAWRWRWRPRPTHNADRCHLRMQKIEWNTPDSSSRPTPNICGV